MTDALKILVCANRRGLAQIQAVCEHVPSVKIAAVAGTGTEAVTRHRAETFDAVAIAGDPDGTHGVRVAGALAREREVPTILLVDGPELGWARRQLAARKLSRAVMFSVDEATARPGAVGKALRLALSQAPGPSAGTVELAPRRPAQVRQELRGLSEVDCDVCLLLGSAGTPHLLPYWLAVNAPRPVPLIVAVHHNPHLSESFCEWVGELAGECASTPPLLGALHPRGPLAVVPAEEDPTTERLLPDLSRVVDRTLDAGLKPLICVASGMAFGGIDALGRATRAGAVVVVLEPSRCTAPSMPSSVIAAGLARHVVTSGEMAWVIANGASGAARKLAATG